MIFKLKLTDKNTTLNENTISHDEIIQHLANIDFKKVNGVIITNTANTQLNQALITVNNEIIDLKAHIQDNFNVPVVVNPENDLIDFAQVQENNTWEIEYNGYTGGKKERSRESLLTVANGFMGVRGALEETKASDDNYPATFVAGMYNKVPTKIADKDIYNEDFVNTQVLTNITFSLDKKVWFNPNINTDFELVRKLDFKNGLMTRKMVVKFEGYNFEINSSRFVSMNNEHIFAMKYTVSSKDYQGTVYLKVENDADIINYGVERYRDLTSMHLDHADSGVKELYSTLKVKTNQSNINIVSHANLITKMEIESQTSREKHNETILMTNLSPANNAELEKVVSLYTSLETKSNLDESCQTAITMAGSFDQELSKSQSEWQKIIQKTDIKVKGDMHSQKLIRLHNFHLIASASPKNEKLDVSITARGLHGEAYRGHIFWDEIFMLPYYDVHYPNTAKKILMYRYNRLDKAREYASEYGYEGAMFPWQSGSDGSEETQVIHLNPISGEWGDDYSSYQRHVGLAIAYNVWQYVNITDDTEFFQKYGAEMILDIAKFWLSKGEFNQSTQKFTIDKVMGPDEFHESYPGTHEGGLKNNAYTNMMVVWLFEQIADLKSNNPELYNQISQKINLTTSHEEKMNSMMHNLFLEIDQDGIIAQYEGYLKLKELDWDFFKSKYGNIYRMDRLLKAEGKSADDYKVAKQADTLMTFYNLDKNKIDKIINDLGYKLPQDYLTKNLEYYLQRTSHGSTLSRVVHAKLAQMVDNQELSWSLFKDALGSDYMDVQGGTTAEGIHTGVMSATLVVAMSTYGGVDLREEVLNVNPALPKHWESMEFNLTFRKIDYTFIISHESINVTTSKPTKIILNGKEEIIDNNSIIKY
jgi:trehalose/maltose hydrolase-like predicted phosphorylase